MKLPDWRSPSAADVSWIRNLSDEYRLKGSDVAAANLFLLRNKYNIEISVYNGILLRYYNGTGSRHGYGFPIGVKNNSELKNIIALLQSDALNRATAFELCLVNDDQKLFLESALPGMFSYTNNPGDGDYIYLQENLACLKGRAYHKKKNHVSAFTRKYPEFNMKLISESDAVVRDALNVVNIWNKDKGADVEYASILEALQYIDELGLFGGVLYVNDEPVAMTLASAINSRVCDIHYEKAIGNCAANGAYSVINQLFAETLSEYDYINREEDIGIEGLRKAKQSYHPTIFLDKYHCVLK